VSILLWWLWWCLIGHVLSSNILLYPGSRTTGVCSTCKCMCLSFHNIYYIIVTSLSDCHCCHWYCNINNNNYATESRQQERTYYVLHVNVCICPSTISTILLLPAWVIVTIVTGAVIKMVWFDIFSFVSIIVEMHNMRCPLTFKFWFCCLQVNCRAIYENC
jgi:hypothetical protein